MERIPKETQTTLKQAYNKMVRMHKEAFLEAYPAGTRFVKKYVDRRDGFDAVFVVTGHGFKSIEYEKTTWYRSPLFSCHVLYKKLDKRGRPNGKERRLGISQLDAGCHLGTCE